MPERAPADAAQPLTAGTDTPPAKAGLTPCQKGTIACVIGTLIVLAIMIPVSIYVIAPSMGQHALNVAVMNIPNSTVFDLPDNLHFDKVAKIFNDVSLEQSSLPFGAKLHETQLVMNVPPGSGFGSWDQRNLGWFTMPEESISHGDNKFQVTEPFHIFENTDDFVHWAFTLTFGGAPYGTIINVVGSPKLSALGIFHMDLKMGKRLNCTYIPGPTAEAIKAVVPDEALLQGTSEEASTARRLALAKVRGMGPVTLTCKDEGELQDDEIDAILTNFTRDLEHPITTATTTTTIAPATTTAAATTPAPATPVSV